MNVLPTTLYAPIVSSRLLKTVSGLIATDKTPMHEMPLSFVFGGWGFGVGGNIYCNAVLGVSVLTLALCLEVIILPFLQVLPVAIR